MGFAHINAWRVCIESWLWLPPSLPRMVCRAMGVRWNTCGTQISCFAIFILVLGSHGCWSLNSEGKFVLVIVGEPHYQILISCWTLFIFLLIVIGIKVQDGYCWNSVQAWMTIHMVLLQIGMPMIMTRACGQGFIGLMETSKSCKSLLRVLKIPNCILSENRGQMCWIFCG